MKKLFDKIPYLTDNVIILRQLTDNDAGVLKDMTGNETVYRYEPTFLFEKQFTDMHQMIRELYDVPFRTKQNLILAIEIKETQELCGLGEFYGFKDLLHKTCIGYRLLQEHWGKGIATRAAKLMTDYLLSETDIEIITASTMIENKASAHVLENTGFTLVASAVPEDWGYPQPTLTNKWIL